MDLRRSGDRLGGPARRGDRPGARRRPHPRDGQHRQRDNGAQDRGRPADAEWTGPREPAHGGEQHRRRNGDGCRCGGNDAVRRRGRFRAFTLRLASGTAQITAAAPGYETTTTSAAIVTGTELSLSLPPVLREVRETFATSSTPPTFIDQRRFRIYVHHTGEVRADTPEVSRARPPGRVTVLTCAMSTTAFSHEAGATMTFLLDQLACRSGRAYTTSVFRRATGPAARRT